MSTKEFKIFNRSNRESSWIAAESARLACIQNENRLRMLRGEKQLLSEKSKAVHDSSGDMIHVSVGDNVCSGLKCNVVRDLVSPTPADALQIFEECVDSAIKAVSAELGATASISAYRIDGDGGIGSYAKILVDVSNRCECFDFRMTKKGWIRIRAVSGGYTAKLQRGSRFFEVDGIEYERKPPVARTVDELSLLSHLIATYETLDEALRGEIRPFAAIWSTTPSAAMLGEAA